MTATATEAVPRHHFPQQHQVDVAAAMFERAQHWNGDETRTFRVEVTPGTVALEVRDPARRERSYELQLRRRGILRAGTRVPIAEWSRKSRSRMVRRYAAIDYTPLLVLGKPAMLTLTYPGQWQQLVPDGATAKQHLHQLRKRWERRWSVPMVGLWKLEFQRRGAPHFHLFVVPPGEHQQFRAWLSLTWAEIVNAPAANGERRRHVLAGTGIDYAQAARCADPKRLAVYFLKHGTKTRDDKEYQHRVPQLWRDNNSTPGRFWGYWHLRPAARSVELQLHDFLRARRVMRRYARCTRRRNVMTTARLQGGWIAVNNAPTFAFELARYLDQLRT